jgi:hypothetical protein
MLRQTKIDDLTPGLAEQLRTTEMIVNSYLRGLSFVVQDTARDPKYVDNHLLFYLAQDFLQSSVSITSLAVEGLLSVAKRELRFIIEARSRTSPI